MSSFSAADLYLASSKSGSDLRYDQAKAKIPLFTILLMPLGKKIRTVDCDECNS